MTTEQTPDSAAEPCTPDRKHRIQFDLSKTVACWLIVGFIALVVYAIWASYRNSSTPPGTIGNGPPEKELRMIALDIALGQKRTANDTIFLLRTSTGLPSDASNRLSELIEQGYSVSKETIAALHTANKQSREISKSDYLSTDNVRFGDGIPGQLQNCPKEVLSELWKTHDDVEGVVEMSQFGWTDDEGLLYIGWIDKETRVGRGSFLVFRRYKSQFSCESLPEAWSDRNN